MSYLVFARKYRPQTFGDILGQETIVTTLTNAIRQGRIGQAYLFAGPRGTGKTSTARIFSKGLNCAKGPTPKPCLKCERCQEITEGRSLDVLEIDGASNRGIDQIRALRELAKFTPAASAYKVYIIDEVHQITPEGFNALLKILEEPPPHVVFVLATTAPHKVPPTILSRCQRYDFRRLSIQVIQEKLRAIAKEESLAMNEEAGLAIARAAGGSLRDAESILDQAASFTGGKIQEEDVRALLGTLDEASFAQAARAILERKQLTLLKGVAEATHAGTDLVQWALGFLGYVRNILVAKAGAGPLGFEEIGEAGIEEVRRLAQDFSSEELMAMAQVLTTAVETMRRVGEPRIPLEMALIRLSSSDSLVAVSELMERLQEMESRLWGGGEPPAPLALSASAPTRPTSESTPAQPASGRSESAPALSAAPSASLDEIRALWPRFLDELHKEKASVAAYLDAAVPFSLEGADPPALVLGLPKGFEFHKETLDQEDTRRLIQRALERHAGLHVRCALRIVEDLPQRAGDEAASVSTPAQADPPAADEPAQPQPKPDPSFLQSVAKLFEGRIIPGEG